jgi:hypothetical protein
MYRQASFVVGLSSYLEAVCEDLPVLKPDLQFDELRLDCHKYGGHHRPQW